MKLRIRKNSLRLRLTKGDVEKFEHDGEITDSLSFMAAGDRDFYYSLVSSGEVEHLSAEFLKGKISIHVPRGIADKWIQTAQVGFDGVQELSVDKNLKILIEKDFVCLTDRKDEDESDNYAHPNAEKVC